MTGFGRTGTMFACEQAGIAPDMICLSKGITGGYLPLSCVLSTDAIYAAFYADDSARGFLHSHSYTGNALACRAALAVLDIFRDDDVIAANRAQGGALDALAAPLAAHPNVRDFRHRGMIWAFEVDTDAPGLRALVLRRGPRARAPAAADRPHRLFHAALHPDRRRVRAARRRARARSSSARDARRCARCAASLAPRAASAPRDAAARRSRARFSTPACRSPRRASSCRTSASAGRCSRTSPIGR